MGARPNFVKMAPGHRRAAATAAGRGTSLVHTGQHYDRMMSAVFLEELGVPDARPHARVGSGSHATQTARVMERIEPVLEAERPELIDRARGRQLDPGRRPRRRQARGSRSPTSRPGCAASTARCRRRSTASWPTSSRSYLFMHSRRGDRATCSREGIADGAHPLRRQHDDRQPGGGGAALPRARARRARSAWRRATTCW